MTTHNIKVDVYCGSLYDLDNMTVEELTGWVQMLVMKIPEEYRNDSSLNVHCDSHGTLKLCYWRPRTELDEREDRERDAAFHRREYEEYQRLKAKYEGGRTGLKGDPA